MALDDAKPTVQLQIMVKCKQNMLMKREKFFIFCTSLDCTDWWRKQNLNVKACQTRMSAFIYKGYSPYSQTTVSAGVIENESMSSLKSTEV